MIGRHAWFDQFLYESLTQKRRSLMKLNRNVWLSISLALVLALAIGATNAALAEEKATQDWKFHDIVDVEFVQKYVKVPMPEDVMVIDSRPKRSKYDKGHIPLAVNIPDTKFDKMTDKLPENKNTLLIFYCGGPT